MRLLVATGAVLFACGGAPSPSPAPGPSPEPDPKPDPTPEPAAKTVECYFGTGAVTLANGQRVADTEALARRTLDSGAQTITEEFVSLKPMFQRFVVTMKVTDNTFVMSEAKGAFEGSGELVGEPWKWTSWQSESNLPDGTRVVSKDQKTQTGIEVEKTVYGADGNVVATVTEALALIEHQECNERFANLPTAGNLPK